jgi:hypothetical protein
MHNVGQELDHFPLIFFTMPTSDMMPTMRPTMSEATRSVHSILMLHVNPETFLLYFQSVAQSGKFTL